MTSKIEVPRELALALAQPVIDGEKLTPERFAARAQIASLLAAPEAPRQEPAAAFEVSHGPMGDDGAPIWVRLKDLQDFDIENLADGTKLYLSAPAPLSPDHLGGGAGMVLPDLASLLREAYEAGDHNVFGTDLDDRIKSALDKIKELNQ